MDDEVLDAIRTHETDLVGPGVLSVRPGYVLEDGWPTSQRAVVVTVEPGALPRLPGSVGGFVVDVRAASAAKRLRLADPAAYVRKHGADPDTGAVPEFPDELVAARAATRSSGSSPTVALVPAPSLPSSSLPSSGAVEGVQPEASKPELAYTPADVPLAPITVDTTIVASTSPDNGWSTLKAFLAATRTTLDVAMYDFTSAHVLSAVQSLPESTALSLVLDHPAKNPTSDQTDDQTVAALDTTFGHRFSQAWALERMDPHATSWIFPSAYHIKVAVRDGSSTWISSGNWNNSNQPDIDPAHSPSDATKARSSDRDWHLVVDGPELAVVFGAYIDHDRGIAAEHNAEASGASERLELMPAVETPPFAQFFAPQTFSGSMRITPLLTPDPGVYVDAVRALIAGATKTLHMQFQYIKPPATASDDTAAFTDLVAAVAGRQKAGVEVRIIMAQWETSGYLEQLQAAGLDVTTGVRIQGNVHNKGIVVDGARVLVSSQNWSSDGVLRNRDAGVIVEHEGIAGYFDQVFEHDWEHLATAKPASD